MAALSAAEAGLSFREIVKLFCGMGQNS